MSKQQHLDWDDFRLVKTIAEANGLAGAAERLGVNHSTVFRRLGQMEENLGVKLFERHRNVRTCLSGHIHEVDRVDYQGVSYYCNGAVSGAWWKGKHHDCSEGYAMMNLYDDGTVEREYVPYGWRARE